jgi:hypothetical protein
MLTPSSTKNAFLAFAVTMLLTLTGSPIAYAIVWGILAAQSAAAAWITWKRTGLQWYAINMFHVAAIAAAVVPFVLAGYTISTMPIRWMLVFGVNIALAIAMNIASQYEDREKTARWKAAASATASVTDFFTFRNIPNLR